MKHTEAARDAEFIERNECIGCGGKRLEEVSSGRFVDEPLRGFLEADPWGESPLPHLKRAHWSFVACRDCKQMFHRRILAPAWNERRFSHWMNEEVIREFEEKHAGNEKLARAIGRGKDHVAHALRIEKLTRGVRGHAEEVRVVDFGCGFGEFLAMCQQFGFASFGVDRSPGRRNGGVVTILESIEKLVTRTKGEPFHAVTLFETLEHLDEPFPTLARLRELVVPNGVLVLETPNCEGVRTIASETDYRLIHPLDHINAFTPETLRGIAERAGFRPIDRGPAHVTADRLHVLKNEVKQFLRSGVPTTQQYFVADPAYRAQRVAPASAA